MCLHNTLVGIDTVYRCVLIQYMVGVFTVYSYEFMLYMGMCLHSTEVGVYTVHMLVFTLYTNVS